MKDKSTMFAIMRERGTNLIDDLTTGLVNNMRFSDSNVLYPSEGKVEPGEGVEAEWFYDSFKAPNGTSELDTIHMYIAQEAMFEELGELMMGIALVEMKHLDKLADLIKDLVGRVDRPNDTNKIKYGSSAEEAVHIAIAGETAAIKGYEALTERISALPRNGTTRYALALLAKLLADERFHVALFEEWLRGNAKK